MPCGRRSARNAPLFSPYRRSIAEKADEPRGYSTTSLVRTPVYVAAGGIGTNGRGHPPVLAVISTFPAAQVKAV